VDGIPNDDRRSVGFKEQDDDCLAVFVRNVEGNTSRRNPVELLLDCGIPIGEFRERRANYFALFLIDAYQPKDRLAASCVRVAADLSGHFVQIGWPFAFEFDEGILDVLPLFDLLDYADRPYLDL
jgi:hypothetical protein